jgi:RND family efflux transporter MFP subunit
MKLKLQAFPLRLQPRTRMISAAALAVTFGVLWAARHSDAEPAAVVDAAAPTAGVAKVTREDLFKQVTISAEFRPYEEVELHAKVSGYVKDITVDIGDKVKAGQLLAELEVPELKDQLDSALATAQKAEADYTNASLIYNRLKSVNEAHPNLVAEQELDTAEANAHTTAAAVAAAHAGVEKYQTLIAYTKITAPFDGVVTRRSADPGELIQAGTSSDTQARPLVRVSNNYRLRLDFPVTVDYVKNVHVGDTVTVRVDSLNNKTLTGKISRSSGIVDDNTRTMITEIELPNPDLALMPGMYAAVALNVEKRSQVLAVPTEAISGEKSPVVFVVNSNHQIEERPVKLGLETPQKYEVLSGLQEGDLVVIGNHSAFQRGEKVEPKLIQLSMRNEN